MHSRWILVTLVSLAVVAGIGSGVQAQNDSEQITARIETFMNAFNARSSEGMQASALYPHVFSMPDGTIETYTDPEELVIDYEQLVELRDWAVTELGATKIIQQSPTKAHVTVDFNSYDSTGAKYQSSSAIWVLIKKDGEWKISMRSWLGPAVATE